MITIINAADDEYEIGKLDLVGPTLAIAKEDATVFNHQTCFTHQLLQPRVSQEEEAKAISALLKGQDVVLCLNVNGMFADYIETYEELADLDIEDDFYLEGKVLDVRPGQLKVQTDDDESEWIPFKHIDTVEMAAATGEAYEYAEMEETN